jgi:hypothetical protein
MNISRTIGTKYEGLTLGGRPALRAGADAGCGEYVLPILSSPWLLVLGHPAGLPDAGCLSLKYPSW